MRSNIDRLFPSYCRRPGYSLLEMRYLGITVCIIHRLRLDRPEESNSVYLQVYFVHPGTDAVFFE